VHGHILLAPYGVAIVAVAQGVRVVFDLFDAFPLVLAVTDRPHVVPLVVVLADDGLGLFVPRRY
jgi:hypothetical protein